MHTVKQIDEGTKSATPPVSKNKLIHWLVSKNKTLDVKIQTERIVDLSDTKKD